MFLFNGMLTGCEFFFFSFSHYKLHVIIALHVSKKIKIIKKGKIRIILTIVFKNQDSKPFLFHKHNQNINNIISYSFT
jgi:hypothetical protein